MSQITLTMAPSSTDSDLYPLGHVGSLRWERSKRPFVASAQADTSCWRFAQTGRFRQNAIATDADAGPLLLAAFVVRAQILCTVPAGL
jgi:hypothetical protein